ncbi:MAG: LysE family transporter [Actinomycetota bacterium]|nr:LysE family transporter [Actinomycetota bacterium]
MAALSDAAAAFGVGVALGAAPGPVQLVLLNEASRGGLRRGFRAMAGANGTFALLLSALAAGLSFLSPGPVTVRVMKVVGGAFLLFVAASAVRDTGELEDQAPRVRLGPTQRGALAVVLNPGAWLFLATTGSAVVAAASRDGGRPLAFLTVAALMAGVALIDGTVVLIGGGGAARLTGRAARAVRLVLAATLAGIGVWFLFQGIRP